MPLQTQVGPQRGANASFLSARASLLGDLIVSELHGRFFEQTYQGNVYSTGITATSIANATFTSATALSATLGTAATATPIIGLWNASSLTSGINAVILQAQLAAFISASTATGTGGLIWAVYTGSTALSAASQQVPVNCKSFLATGSQCKGISTLALSGLVNTGLFLRASALTAGPATGYSQVGTAVGFPGPGAGASVENIDGSIIVPPGGILGLFATVTPVAISAAAGLTWEEVPLV